MQPSEIDIQTLVNYSKYMDPNVQPPIPSVEPPQTRTKLILLIVGGLGAFILLVILVAISFFSANKPQQPPSEADITPPQTNVSPSTEKVTSQTYKLTETFNPKAAVTADLMYYTLKYPQDWPPVMNYTSKTDNSFLFSIFPESISGDAGYFPRLDISYTYASVSGSVQKRADMLLFDANSQEVQTTFHGYDALKISGPLHMTLLDSNPSGQSVTVYKTYYVFQKGNLIYLVDYAYTGDKYDSQYEKYFNDILKTLTFK